MRYDRIKPEIKVFAVPSLLCRRQQNTVSTMSHFTDCLIEKKKDEKIKKDEENS
jgi:hypothetical protein